ncbi:hypothetical protein AJ80_05730 [Polytolypa hystricis UAMH7299]|uniref:Membrane anchor Opy2 N-terminal domain-containing protein n=1 Tax=Polytolypa hystricis (strain UAMH7299) TaxID=1447883 RepID=A0A2B7Y2P0_POLH7|nr:hypothetical protein AJ80_05730 [Polytolypa hystricis UAMH7299]
MGRSIPSLFRRCVKNCPSAPPDCPECKDTETCSIVSQSCDSCATTTCIPLSAVSGSIEEKSSPNTGAIAGGVVGGIAFIAILGLIWWYCKRNKRKRESQMTWTPDSVEKRNTFATARGPRQSTAASIASTVLTRASNVIQIAYIPGVTNRSPPDTPGVLVPPVPPLPAASGGTSTYSQDQHFFMPGDIRDSVWSSMSEDNRKSISPSLARSSVATTIYRNNAIVSPIPAQQALRGKAAVVSVKSGANSPIGTPGIQTPRVPDITPTQLEKANNFLTVKSINTGGNNKLGIGNSSIVARTVVARPINVTKSKPSTISEADDKSTRTPTIVVEGSSAASESESVSSHSRAKKDVEDSSSDSESDATSSTPLTSSNNKGNVRESRVSMAVTEIEDSPVITQSPFADPKKQQQQHSATSSALPEGFSQQSSSRHSGDGKTSFHRHRSSQGSAHMLNTTHPSGSGPESPTQRSMSPFADENEVKP